ncbi:indole-diterpene biosynthesis protein-like protein PaxU [Xylaria sp. FL1777]|nr:indole-diterpene biosynthesis protein-like protein PaxU [Xylaria sp. FL1777]
MVQTRGYVRLGPNISLYTPREPKVGQLVVLCPSLGIAGTRLISHSMALYHKNTPHAKVLILNPSISSMISPYSRQEDAMKPAEDAVCQILSECGHLQSNDSGSGNSNTKPRILLHIMGNGGINSATNLLVVLERRLKRSLPLVGLICDSTPIGASYTKTCRALTYSLAQGISADFPLGLIVWVSVHILLSIVYLFFTISRYEAPGDRWRKSILHEKLIECKRIYYFSSVADKMTDWRDVLSHAEQARKEGWEVKEFLFHDTPHCRHVDERKYKNDYSNAVYSLWENKNS